MKRASSKSISKRRMTNSFALSNTRPLPGLRIKRKTNPESIRHGVILKGNSSAHYLSSPFLHSRHAAHAWPPARLLYIRNHQPISCAFQGSFLTSIKGSVFVSGEGGGCLFIGTGSLHPLESSKSGNC